MQPTPGPGQYMQNKYQFAAEIEQLKKNKISGEKASFNTSSERSNQ